MAHPNFQNSMLGDLTLSELVAPFTDPQAHGDASGQLNGAARERMARLRAVDSPG